MAQWLLDHWPKFPNKQTRFFAVMYLCNLVIPFLFLWMLPLQRALIGLGLVLLFAGVYLCSYFIPRKYLGLFIALETGLMLLMIWLLNSGYVWMIFYPTAAAGVLYADVRKIVRALLAIWGLIVLELVAMYFVGGVTLGDLTMIGAAVVTSTAAAFGTMWQTQTVRSHKQLRKANAQIERLTKAAERDRISQDLHDVMGHELSMITLKAQLVQRLIDHNPDRARAEARDIEAAARKALTRVREYIADVRQPRLDEEWEDAVKLLTAAGIRSVLDAVPAEPWQWLAHDVSQALAMCLRESITNIVRHSKANEVRLKAWMDADTLHLAIVDDGVGLSALDLGDEVGSPGHGLIGIRARMSAVGGRLSIWSNGKTVSDVLLPAAVPCPWRHGTAICLTVPLADAEVAAEQA